jgi:hypothetical protein
MKGEKGKNGEHITGQTWASWQRQMGGCCRCCCEDRESASVCALTFHVVDWAKRMATALEGGEAP